MRFSHIVLAASSAAISQAVFISNNAFTGLTVGVSFDVTFKESVGPTELYEATGTGNNVVGQKLVGTAPAGTTDIPWTPTTGGTDITLVIVDKGSPDATPTNYIGPLTVTGPTASSSTSSSSSTTASSGSSSKSGSSATTSTGSVTTTVVPVNTTVLIHSSTKVYTMNGTVSATSSGIKTTTGAGQTTGSGSTSIPTQVPSSSAAGIASPLAFVFLALAALVTLN